MTPTAQQVRAVTKGSMGAVKSRGGTLASWGLGCQERLPREEMTHPGGFGKMTTWQARVEKSRAQGTKDQLQIWRWVHWSPEGEGRWGQGLGQYGLGACVKEEAFREGGMMIIKTGYEEVSLMLKIFFFFFFLTFLFSIWVSATRASPFHENHSTYIPCDLSLLKHICVTHQ